MDVLSVCVQIEDVTVELSAVRSVTPIPSLSPHATDVRLVDSFSSEVS